MMKKILYTTLIATMAVGCIKQEYTASTLHPNSCKLTLYTNAVAEDALTFINGEPSKNYLDTLITPNKYNFIAYGQTDDLKDYTKPATSSTISVPIYLKEENGVVPSVIDDIYYGIKTTKLERDTDRPISLSPLSITRTVTINYDIVGDASQIKDITSTLTGLTEGWDLYSNTPIGGEVSTHPEFTVENNQLTATIKLLGVNITATNTLTTTITYQDGSVKEFSGDITETMSKVNGTLNRIIYAGNVTTNN